MILKACFLCFVKIFRTIFDCLTTGALIWTLLNTLTSLLAFRRPRADWHPAPQPGLEPGQTPRVSVLIPARNEAHRIQPCLESLTTQTFGAMEILVLDDQSTDDTADVIRRFGFVDDDDSAPRRLLHGSPLPSGWKGKAWACWQLANAARGDYLLFTDADTVHHPQCVEKALELAQTPGEKADLLSLWPHQETRTWSEKLIIPYLYLLILGFLPQALVRLFNRHPALARRLSRDQMRSFGSANGQFLLFQRESYFQVGGHETVRGHLVEDIGLGRAVAQVIPDGLKLVNADGIELVSCRMYEGFPDLWEGFSKNLRPAFEKNTGTFVAFGMFQLLTFILPFFRVGRGLWTGWDPYKHKQPMIQSLLALAIRGALGLRFRTSFWGIMLQPFAHTLALIIALNSWRLTLSGKLQWKGRQYSAE